MGGRRGGAQVLEPAAIGGADRHFSDVVSAAVLSHVALTAGVPAEQVLERAGDTRAADDVASGAGWSDHDQFRALLRSAAAALGGPAALSGVGATISFDDDAAHPYVDALHGLGSPAGLYRAVEELASLFMPAAHIGVEVTGPTSCTVRMTLRPGLESFPELCALVAGMLSLLPRPFGCDTAEVEHTTCRCDGAPTCTFAVTWSESSSPAVLRDIVQSRRRAERARLDGLLEALGTVAAGGTIERTLEQLVSSTERATHGLGIVLVLLAGAPSATAVFSSGVDPVRTRAVAAQLRGEGPGFGGPVVPVAGPHGRYGHLAVVPHNGLLTKDQLEVVEAYAQIAAAALGSAAAQASVDPRAAGGAWLLELSAALAEATTVDDTAARIGAAAPGVLDCDQAVVVVRDQHLPIGRLAAVHGFPPEAAARMQRLVVPMFDAPGTEPAVQEESSPPRSELDRCMVLGGSSAWISLPLVADDHVAGVLVAGVAGGRERLESAQKGQEHMPALVRLAAVALRTAAGHEQSHHDALHDGLTGLGNRVLFLDRVALVVDRVGRNGTSGAVLVIDLDDFSALNDRLGRGAADGVLQAVAGRLALALRRTDSVCRLGADTFAAVLECTSGSAATAAERVLTVLRAPLPVDGGAPVAVTASIGLARIEPGGQSDPEALLADAVEAQRVARTVGGDRVIAHVLPAASAG